MWERWSILQVRERGGREKGREGEGEGRGGEGRERERLILKVPLYMQKDWQN